MKTHIHNLFIAFGFAIAFCFNEVKATTVFPIATNNADISLSMASDGTNYLVGIQGDYAGPGYHITAQMFGPTGALIGARINPVPGHTTGGYPFTACSGTNYLMVWPDNYLAGNYSSISGQRISPSGGLIGGMIAITTSSQQGGCSVAFGGGKYLVVYDDHSNGANWAVHGQLVSSAGALVGSSFVISAPVNGQDEKGASVAFDGTNFLVVWQFNSTSGGYHSVTYGVFVSPSGTMGTPFAIGQTVSLDRNPLALVFNGTNYLVVWNIDFQLSMWNIYGRFVTPSGTFPGNEFAIVSNGYPIFPHLAFDGTNYLLNWTQGDFFTSTNIIVQFQFLNSSGQPTGPQFTPFTAQGSEVPLFASLLYDGKRFVSAATLSANGLSATDNAGIYGTFIPVRYGIADTSTWVVNKHQYFNQTNSGLPVFQNPSTPYDFEAAAEPSTPGLVLGLSVKLPNATSHSGLPENDAPGYGVNAQFATLAALDAAYPAGQYVLTITNANDGIKVVTNNLPASVYPSVPHISNYDAAQNINPLADFTVTWDAFTNGTANDLVRLRVSDTNGNTVFTTPSFTTGDLTGLSNSVVIPAKTLMAAETYSASLDFLKVINIDTNSYPGAIGLTLFWKETDFTLNATAQTFTTLYNFTGSDGTPAAGLTLSGNTLYGTTMGGGSSFSGTVFKINTDGTGLTTLYSFTGGNDGANPQAELFISENTLYGTTIGGGSSGNGVVFRVNTDGTSFTNLHSFTALNAFGGTDGTNGDGATPWGGAVVVSGNTLYGTAEQGGILGWGTVFKVNTDGTGFTVLHNFGDDGAYPLGGLILSGNTLYGTANSTVFAINTDGTDFSNLCYVSASVGNLISSGNTLYGATDNGTPDDNTVFAVNTDGTGFRTLYTFSGTDTNGINSDGASPMSGLALSGNTLYGTAEMGGTSGNGTVFAVNTDGTGFTTLHSFTAPDQTYNTNSDGAYPNSGVVVSGNTVYGTAFGGGSSGLGTVFGVPLGTASAPQLTLLHSGANVILTWPTNAAGFTLESTTNLVSPAVWITNSPAPVVVNGKNTVTNSITGSRTFYRLTQ